MKNDEIILNERLRLMDEGIIKSTGNLIKIQLPNGSWIQVPEPEMIHTRKKWLTLNRIVKDDEKPVTVIMIWKPYQNSKNKGVTYKNAEFFTRDQTKDP